jgi:hypothetical protein
MPPRRKKKEQEVEKPKETRRCLDCVHDNRTEDGGWRIGGCWQYHKCQPGFKLYERKLENNS